MRQGMYEIWEEQVRVTEMALQQLPDDHHAQDRQRGEAAGDLPEVAVQQADTEGDARGGEDIPEEDSTVLGAVAHAAEDRIQKGSGICGRDLYGAQGVHTDLL